MTDCIRDVYKVYKERAIAADSSEVATAYPPEIVVIHSLQRYVDLINENPTLKLTQNVAPAVEEPAPAPAATAGLDIAQVMFAGANLKPAPAASGSKKGMPDTIAFCAAFKELLDRGGKYNIHFVVSLDDPLAMAPIKTELISAMFKVFVKGVSNNVLTQMLGDYKSASALTNPKVAMVCHLDERTKVRMYRYDPETDASWYRQLCDNYRFLLEEKQ